MTYEEAWKDLYDAMWRTWIALTELEGEDGLRAEAILTKIRLMEELEEKIKESSN